MEEIKEVEEKTYRCTACRYRGKPIVHDIPPQFKGQIDSRGMYCPKCRQDMDFRSIPQMQEE